MEEFSGFEMCFTYLGRQFVCGSLQNKKYLLNFDILNQYMNFMLNYILRVMHQSIPCLFILNNYKDWLVHVYRLKNVLHKNISKVNLMCLQRQKWPFHLCLWVKNVLYCLYAWNNYTRHLLFGLTLHYKSLYRSE